MMIWSDDNIVVVVAVAFNVASQFIRSRFNLMVCRVLTRQKVCVFCKPIGKFCLLSCLLWPCKGPLIVWADKLLAKSLGVAVFFFSLALKACCLQLEMAFLFVFLVPLESAQKAITMAGRAMKWVSVCVMQQFDDTLLFSNSIAILLSI